jgi:hypothetical protein
MSHATSLFRLGVPFLLMAAALHAASVGPPPKELVEAWHLSGFYQRHLDVDGFPILASGKVSDYALREADFLIRKMVGHRPDILRALTENHVRFVVMAPSEMTTAVPEHSSMKPAAYWNRRARGLGATRERPVVSCGEENLLCLPGDPYRKENILVHEFSHAIHEMGLSKVDPTFDGRLKKAFEAAMEEGLWTGTYPSTNKQEYWAEGAQCWFDCAGSHDREHGDVDTREKIKSYDPALSALLAEVFGDEKWRYQKPAQRAAEERGHLAGFDAAKAPHFEWPKNAPPFQSGGALLPWLSAERMPSASPSSSQASSILFVNQRSHPLDLDWIAFDGSHKKYASVRPGMTHLVNTFTGHAWLVLEDGKPIGGVVAGEPDGRAEVKP